MNPQEQIAQLRQEVELLKSMVIGMQRPNSVSPEFQQVLDRTVVSASGHTLASETQAVDEGGSATYNVPKLGDGFITIGGYNLMYWS